MALKGGMVIKLAAFLIILVILFGIEGTRNLVFGAFGFIFWIVIACIGVYVFCDAFGFNETPEEKAERKKKEAKEKAEEKRQLKENYVKASPALKVYIGLLIGTIVCSIIGCVIALIFNKK